MREKTQEEKEELRIQRTVINEKKENLKRIASELEKKYHQILGQLALLDEMEKLAQETVITKSEEAKNE